MSAKLGEEGIEKLFSGAPQFFCRTEKHYAGAPHPVVAFPYDEELEIRDLADHVQIEDKAWSGVTARPHLTRDLNHDPAAVAQRRLSAKAHFHVRCNERPNMLSMQGLEKGTVGYQAALELPAGDSLEEEQFGFESVGTKGRVIVEARERIMSTFGWLRRISENEILDRLKVNGVAYRSNDLRRRPSSESYRDLFHIGIPGGGRAGFMRPAETVIDRTDHHSLVNQINALVRCLATPNVWIDLSRIEWRIRLGQVLWGQDGGDDLEDPTGVHDAPDAAQRAEEKYWLLMQILVSTELLIRLDAVTEGEQNGTESYRPNDSLYFERQATESLKWSLLLARSWLENIEVVEHDEYHRDVDRQQAAAPGAPQPGWLASVVGKLSSTLRHAPHHYLIRGRNGQRQVDGLMHFARKIQWPGIDDYESHISRSVKTNMKTVANPESGQPSLTVPGTTTTAAAAAAAAGAREAGRAPSPNLSEPSYFGAWDVTGHRGHPHPHRAPYPQYQKIQAPRRKVAAALHPSGWLSKTYIFALMLPGEALSHFLMATLLENDAEALGRLGPFANLCDGFLYHGKTFWSTACIVGRVLAAGQGAAECMGWISTSVLPKGIESDRWLNIEVEDVADDLTRLGKKARIWGKRRLERDSSIVGDSTEMSAEPGDFTMPHENVYPTPPPNVSVQLTALELLSAVETIHPSPLSQVVGTPRTESVQLPDDVPAHPARMTFNVVTGNRTEEVSLTLTYDISFVTAYPCSPSRRVRFVKAPGSPTIQQIDVSGSNNLGKGSRSVFRAGHPLHKFYNYTVMHISELLAKRDTALMDLLRPIENRTPKTVDNRVLVVDCITTPADLPFELMPTSPVTGTFEFASTSGSHSLHKRTGSLPNKMHLECRRRQFGSDMEMLVRALCARKGWNAIISRSNRSCLACAIREAGALGWRVVIRVD
ncbi:hypothetical protein GMORB2_5322 [Geosmithia morbida]|uniref:Helicase-like protein n=1 Tax=Geosmithia morbida TaxID=1094350 RepID=A0A9P4YX25_9HYPO|nr:uncharacterized protein GMORB2_5322 [Geosmithia morbida]KAF4124656.1 hypothetical protein GMORB2_5322 [Geosmithia morbida]